jgi:Domain of unknown function (DUF4158)
VSGNWTGNYAEVGAKIYDDQDLVAARRGAANQLGFAVQLALLRHPGMGLAHMEEPVGVLVEWLAAQLGIPAAAFAARPQTMTKRQWRRAEFHLNYFFACPNFNRLGCIMGRLVS